MNGDLLWIKAYPRPGLETRFYDHEITRDGGIIAVGDLYPPFRGFVVKTDNLGNVKWDSTYNYDLGLSKIIQSTIDQSYYFTVETRVTKIDSIGRLIWTKTYNYIGGDILQTQSGDIYTATGNNAFYLNKIDTSGKLIWQKNYYPNSKCSGLCLSKDGNLLVTGFPTQSLFEIFALKTDLNGNEIFGKTITSFSGNYFALPRNVNSTSDSGFIYSGITDFPNTAMLSNNAFATKTDSVCNTPIFVSVTGNYVFVTESFILSQNYPNPFNPETKINFSIPKSGKVTLKIYDVLGNEVKTIVNEFRNAGSYEITFDGINLPSGVYYYKMESGNFSQVRKMALMK